MADLTSSALIGLVRAAFARRGLQSTAAGGARARAPAEEKHSLLEEGYARFGAEAVLAVGREVLGISWDPVLAVFRRAPTAQQLLACWLRLERYYHSRHRTRIVAAGAGWAVLEHYASRGEAPTLVEDLLIAGLVAGLLQDAGACGLDACLEPDMPFLVAGEPCALDANPAAAARFRLRWAGYVPRTVAEPAVEPARTQDPATRLRELISAQPSHRWRTADAAEALQLTPRTLQRRLTQSGTSFRSILRRSRAEAAARLLSKGVPLAETGFACGYADQAHFTREFRDCVGLAPGSYRDSLTSLQG